MTRIQQSRAGMGDAARSWLEEQPDTEGLSTTACGATWQSSGFARWTA